MSSTSAPLRFSWSPSTASAAQVAANSGSRISRCAPAAAVRASLMRLASAWICSVSSFRMRPDMPLGAAMPPMLSSP